MLVNAITKLAAARGFAKPEHIDIDSTVQSPDMQYPATVNLLVKTASYASRIRKIIGHFMPDAVTRHIPEINMKMIRGIAREHWFEKRRSFKQKREIRKQALVKLWNAVSGAIQPAIRFARILDEPFIMESIPVGDKNLLANFIQKAPALLGELFLHCYENAPLQPGIFSLNRNAVACFNKNKHDRSLEFGRQFQIGRIGGNFVYSIPNNSIRMPDAANFKKMLVQHIEIFQTPIESIGTDKGYYSKDNEAMALNFRIREVAIQKPNRKFRDAPDNPISQEALEILENRRAGIEAIIGHLKKYWQLGRSRMKSDRTTEASGYCAMIGFNLRQMMRYLTMQAATTS